MPYVTLLCLPCAGASATMYLRWRRMLPHWIEIRPVELPGRGARLDEAFATRFEELVARICAEQAEALSGRFALFGHSMGGLLAWGVADHLRTLGRALPSALLVSGSAAPSRRDPERFAGMVGDAALTADLRRQGGTPEAVFASEELMRITLDALAADYDICRSFRHEPGAPLPVPLHVFAGRQDDIAADCIAAWSGEAGHDFTVDWFEGGHFFIRQQEAAFLEALERRLGQALVRGGHAPCALA